MNNLEREYCRAAAQGIRKVPEFSGVITGAPLGFEVGDVFTVPTEFTVLEEMICEVRNQFIFVETQNGEVRRFYPSQLSRRVRAYDKEGNPSNLVIADGTASQLYKMHGSVREGMEALKGKTIRVSKVTKVFTVLWDLPQYKTVYTFDLV